MNFSTIRCWDVTYCQTHLFEWNWPKTWMRSPSGGATYTHRGTCSLCSWAEHWRHSKAPVPSTSSGPRAQPGPRDHPWQIRTRWDALNAIIPTNLMVTWKWSGPKTLYSCSPHAKVKIPESSWLGCEQLDIWEDAGVRPKPKYSCKVAAWFHNQILP